MPFVSTKVSFLAEEKMFLIQPKPTLNTILLKIYEQSSTVCGFSHEGIWCLWCPQQPTNWTKLQSRLFGSQRNLNFNPLARSHCTEAGPEAGPEAGLGTVHGTIYY